ncbi:hypothetical protein [Levilactobacillus namurensis]|uniref:hypothetical protein n=1 Tax=Levilactobacillus namurensis TaxID=380393 RepID=UPI0026E9F5A0|nr:hypothetical protein [Levilactobacillus namurensis]
MRSKAEKLSRRRSRIMKDAHIIAKKIVNNAGSYQVALSFALKFVYAFRADRKAARVAKANGKQYRLKFDGMIYDEATRYFEPKMVAGVPAWAIRKDFMHASAHDIIWFTTATKQVAETEKAVQIEFTTANPKEHGYIDHHTTWVAKSIMAA